MENILVPAQKRETVGSKGAADVRRQGMIPAIIYGGKEPVPVSVKLHDVRHAIYTPDFHKVDVDLDGTKVTCILKEVQFHPVTDRVTHIDFLQLEQGTPVKVEVPIRFNGTAAGIKAGGKLIQKIRKVKIKATPEHLVNEVSMDVTELKLGQSLRVRDIQMEEGVEILNTPGIPVVSVQIPRVLKVEEPTVAEGAAAETPAAEGEDKAKGEAAAGEGHKKDEDAKK